MNNTIYYHKNLKTEYSAEKDGTLCMYVYRETSQLAVLTLYVTHCFYLLLRDLEVVLTTCHVNVTL